jgi:hypothetical protein
MGKLIICTEAGMQIDRNEGQPKKTCVSISLSVDPDSNVTVESEEHP